MLRYLVNASRPLCRTASPKTHNGSKMTSRTSIIFSFLLILSQASAYQYPDQTLIPKLRPHSEIAANQASDDSTIRDAADGEFGISYKSIERVLITARNSKSEFAGIELIGSHYKISCAFSIQSARHEHNWVIFLDENREFLIDFQYPDCLEYHLVSMPETVWSSIKYFKFELRKCTIHKSGSGIAYCKYGCGYNVRAKNPENALPQL